MGREWKSWEVQACLSHHNAPEDDEDRILWGDLRQRLCAIAEEPKYERLRVMHPDPPGSEDFKRFYSNDDGSEVEYGD
jgi:hypothetical protein